MDSSVSTSEMDIKSEPEDFGEAELDSSYLSDDEELALMVESDEDEEPSTSANCS